MVPEIWILLRGVIKNSKDRQCNNALFPYIAKERAIKAYNALTFTEAEEGKYNALVHKFNEFLEGKKDLANERYVFNNRDQKEGENSFFIKNKHYLTGRKMTT